MSSEQKDVSNSETVYETRYDVMTFQGAMSIVDWCQARGAELEFHEIFDIIPSSYHQEIVNYALEALNIITDEYYYLTADCNIRHHINEKDNQ
jgi:hypothetical protein